MGPVMPALRWRTAIRAGNVPGQPARVYTDPDRIPHHSATSHTCGWCGGVNSHTNRMTKKWRVLCHSCMRSEFGSMYGYDQFIRSEIARSRYRGKKRK